MVTDIVILALLVAFVIACLLIVNLLPTLIVKWRAAVLGLDLSSKQAKIIIENFCNKKEFLVGVRDIWFWTDVPIEKLTIHFLAKGDLVNLRDGIIEMKQKNREIDFTTLASIDLAGRNLREEIRKAEKRNWVFDLSEE